MSNAPSSSTCLVYNFSGGSTMNNECFKMSNLKKIREKNNITQIRLSIDLKVSQELISQYEVGKTLPTITNLSKLADFFHCSTDYLLNRTDNPTPVNMLNKNDIEIANIIDKYIFLNNESKKEFINFLDYLVYKNGISH